MQDMRAAKRPPGTVGLEAVHELTMRSGRRIGLVVGCLTPGEQRPVGYGRVVNDAQDLPDGGPLFEIGSVT
jgi:hypothetical protein